MVATREDQLFGPESTISQIGQYELERYHAGIELGDFETRFESAGKPFLARYGSSARSCAMLKTAAHRCQNTL